MGRSRPQADDGRRHFGAGGITAVVLGLLLLLLSPFIPLLLSLLEHATMGTDYVQEFCRTIGIFELLGDFYEMVFSPFF